MFVLLAFSISQISFVTHASPQPIVTPAISPEGEYSANGTRILLQTSMGNITLQLRDDKPITTENFIKIVNQGLYDGTKFDRVISNFVIQSAFATKNMSAIVDEIGQDNHNVIGTIGMAKTNDPNTATSSFFINLVDNTGQPSFDSTFTVFGKVIDGMDVVNAIANTQVTTNPNTGETSYPVNTIQLIKASILPLVIITIERNLDHFEFQTIGSPQTTGVEIQVRIAAMDQNGETYTSYSGSGILSDQTGTNITINFAEGIFNGNFSIASARNQDTLTISSGGKSSTSNSFNVVEKQQNETASSIPILYIIIASVTVVVPVIAIIVYKKRSKKKMPTLLPPPPPPSPSPSKFKVTLEPSELIADGKSKATITIQLLDNQGKPIQAAADTPVKVTTAKGKIENDLITIPRGKDTQNTVIVSSKESGPAMLKFDSEGYEQLTINVNFMERLRYCMHCGASNSSGAKVCRICGKSPPAGLDTKVCENCQNVLPIIARFCNECGAGQQK
jgi:cyclophilin family peptidyl-prolyl cis-trans isomerase/ribosomal protein L40E